MYCSSYKDVQNGENMWELYEEIWDQQIGNKMNIGFDFSGREIHKNDFGNPLSEYGWTLLPFGDNETFLIVHNKTMEEIPEEIDGEFIVNGKTFEIKKSLKHDGNWDINLISYETTEMVEDVITSQKRNTPQNQQINDLDNSGFDSYDLDQNYNYNDVNQNEKFVFDNNEEDYQYNNFDDYSENKDFDDYSLNPNNLDMSSIVDDIESKSNEALFKIQENNLKLSEQQREIDELKKQLKEQQTQQLEISRQDKEEIERLKQKIAQTQVIEAQNRSQVELIRNLNKKLDYQNQEIHSLKEGQKAQVEKLAEKIKELEKTQSISLKKSLENERALIDSVNKKSQANAFNPRSRHINSNLEFNSFYNNTTEIDFSRGVDGYYDSLWRHQFGNKEYASDFANRIISRTKYGKDVDGGWGIDYYDPQISSDSFIASTKTIKERNGKPTFLIDNHRYVVTRNSDGQWDIIKQNSKEYKEIIASSKHLTSIADKFEPKEKKEFSGMYESYSSLIINLNHFPISNLPDFEEFLKQTTKDFPLFKDMYIYSNARAYNDQRTNISAYARVYFKSSSTKDTMKILIFAASMKKAMIKFTKNFRDVNDLKTISFSMVLMNHLRKIKFIQAQTNFEILRANPIPLKIPLERLIIDSEYNAFLKFYENELWKRIKPYALDWQGNTYYICDIDFDNINVEFINY